MNKDNINSFKEAMNSFTIPYRFESELKRAMELNSQHLLSQTDTIKSVIESFTIPCLFARFKIQPYAIIHILYAHKGYTCQLYMMRQQSKKQRM